MRSRLGSSIGRQQERWRDLEPDDIDFRDNNERRNIILTLIAAGVFLVLWITFWLAAQIASLLSGHWLSPMAGLKQTPGALFRLFGHFGTPRLGYSQPLRHEVASAWLLYPMFLTLLGLELRYGWRIYRRWQGRHEPEERGETRWAEEGDLEEILENRSEARGEQSGVILGQMNRRRIRLERETHALVVAGTRAGKTAGLCIPTLLTFPGAVIATSVKNDLLKHTLTHRKQMGDVFVFDPVAVTGLPESEIAGWSPLQTSRTWHGAQRTANALIEASSPKNTAHSDDTVKFFKNMGQQTLPVLLYAAAEMDESMWRVMNWLQHLDEDATLAYIEAILRWTKNRRAFDAWTGFVATERRLKGNIRATIEAALLSYQSEAVEHNSRHCDIVPERLFNGGANTLYVCAPMAEQSRLEPVFVALIQGLLFWITEQPEPQRMPVLVVLDEAANIAALSELPSLISTIGGHNVQLITCWQDFAQMRARYGDQSQSIINNSRAKLVLRGVSDPETIRIFAAMTGEMIESQDSVSVSDSGGKHRSFGETRRSILTPAVIRQQKQGEAILVYGHMPPAKIKLRLWFKDNELRELAGDSPLSVSGPRAQLDRLVQTLPRLPRPVASLRRAVQGVFSRRW